jgi:DHA1 family bicyclomycin/chloramphenicol resistance-like MFS transporter
MFLPESSSSQNSLIAWLLLILIALIASNLNLQLPCLIAIKTDLKTNDFMIQLSLTLGPALAILSNVFFGLWCDRWDKKSLLLICIILFSVGSLICGFAADIYQFLIGRGLQIFGDSGVSIIGFAILATLFEGKKLGEYLGYNTILSTVFGICSPPLGAWVLTSFNWHLNFTLLSFLSFILLILFYFILPVSRPDKGSNLISTKYLLKEYLRQIKMPLFFLAVVIPALCATVVSLFDFYSPVFYMDIYGVSPQVFSYIRVALIAINVTASFGYIFILKMYGIESAFKVGMISHFLYTFGMTLIILTTNHHHPYLLFILTGIQEISLSFINPIGMFKAVSSFPTKEGISLSIFALARNILSAIITLIAAFIFTDSLFPIILIISLISIVLSYLLFLMRKYI